VLEKQGKHDEAKAMHWRTLGGYEKISGEQHPHRLTNFSNLISTLWSEGQWKKTEAIEVRALETRQKVPRDERLDTLPATSTLVFTFKM
jgi:hypothetical protein